MERGLTRFCRELLLILIVIVALERLMGIMILRMRIVGFLLRMAEVGGEV
jgi:hypothetical protein